VLELSCEKAEGKQISLFEAATWWPCRLYEEIRHRRCGQQACQASPSGALTPLASSAGGVGEAGLQPARGSRAYRIVTWSCPALGCGCWWAQRRG